MTPWQYVAVQYEAPGYWHVYSTDAEPAGVSLGATILTVEAPDTQEWRARISAVADAVEAVCVAAGRP